MKSIYVGAEPPSHHNTTCYIKSTATFCTMVQPVCIVSLAALLIIEGYI